MRRVAWTDWSASPRISRATTAKPLPLLARARRLDGRVDRQQVGLVRQVLHRLGDLANLRGALRQPLQPLLDAVHRAAGWPPAPCMLCSTAASPFWPSSSARRATWSTASARSAAICEVRLISSDVTCVSCSAAACRVRLCCCSSLAARRWLPAVAQLRGRTPAAPGQLPQLGQHRVQPRRQVANLVRGHPRGRRDAPMRQPLDGHAHRAGALRLPARQHPRGDGGQDEHQPATHPWSAKASSDEQRAAQRPAAAPRTASPPPPASSSLQQSRSPSSFTTTTHPLSSSVETMEATKVKGRNHVWRGQKKPPPWGATPGCSVLLLHGAAARAASPGSAPKGNDTTTPKQKAMRVPSTTRKQLLVELRGTPGC